MEKIIQFTPAFDKRDPDPDKNYGIHGMNLRFVLKGDKGATQFIVYTNWHLPHVQKELEDKGTVCLIAPMPADVGYHSPIPQYEGQEPISEDCEYIGGPCYYDGSGLRAISVFERFTAEGADAVWKELEEEYNRLFERGEE